MKRTDTNTSKKPIMDGRLLIIVLLLGWAVMMTFYVGILVERQQVADQSEAFRGRYLNMSIEGLSVLQQQLSKTNVRLSAVESEIEKGKVSEPTITYDMIQRRCKEVK